MRPGRLRDELFIAMGIVVMVAFFFWVAAGPAA